VVRVSDTVGSSAPLLLSLSLSLLIRLALVWLFLLMILFVKHNNWKNHLMKKYALAFLPVQPQTDGLLENGALVLRLVVVASCAER
jgi:hypothetical protein